MICTTVRAVSYVRYQEASFLLSKGACRPEASYVTTSTRTISCISLYYFFLGQGMPDKHKTGDPSPSASVDFRNRLGWENKTHNYTEELLSLGFIKLRSCRFSEKSRCTTTSSTPASMFEIFACKLLFSEHTLGYLLAPALWKWV